MTRKANYSKLLSEGKPSSVGTADYEHRAFENQDCDEVFKKTALSPKPVKVVH